MKRSDLNRAYRQASACFAKHHWHLPPYSAWDITDFGLGDFKRHGLVLVNLASEREYCEKLMYARRGQQTPCHAHRRKKEDIICRVGRLRLRLWPRRPGGTVMPAFFSVQINGRTRRLRSGRTITLEAGWRITLLPGVWHEFSPTSRECIIGEVSTVNDDVHDNFFLDPNIGRYPSVMEDAPVAVRLISES
ncbi:MAG TPA: D-lyxose/D-mannose family sugar isomerase [Lacunisphaera sp.]